MINIYDWKDQEDGGASFTIEMDHDELVLFAKEGVMSILTKAAKEIVEQHEKKEFDRNTEIENLHIYKKAIMKMASHRQKEVDDYIRIAKQAVQDDEMNNYKRYSSMDTRSHYDSEVEDEL